MADFEQMVPLLSISQLRHGMSYSFPLAGEEQIEGFLINWHGQIYAYHNSCPHTGVSLNWAPNQFLDIKERFIQCGLHGALFEPDTGFCIHGPCLGQYLQTIRVIIRPELRRSQSQCCV